MPFVGIESYELGEAITVSPPSTFFLGKNLILGSDVMLRRLSIDPARGQDVHETFYREQRLAAALRHPHIHRAIDVFEHDGALWSVHEYDKIRLTSDIVSEDGRLPVGEAARLGAQVADALAHIHAEGYVHGKVSPRWVSVSDRGHAFLLNLVKAADLHAGIWPLRPAVLGLSPFTAPEEFGGERPTTASDVYGLAATIFYWLTGRYPRGGDDEEVATQRARDAAPLLDLHTLSPDVPQALLSRLVDALEADPAERKGSAASLGMLLVEIHQRHAAEIPSGFQTGSRLFPSDCPDGLEIVGRHGAGAFGVVLRAHSACSEGAPLAVKALKPEHREDNDAFERFLREARAMQQIDHENVVGIRGVGEENGTPYVVMDFIGGPDLATLLLREGSFAPDRVASLGAGIARGLEAIHAAGIVHRDLKPHNVLVAAGERAVIADFGIARQDKATRLTMTGQLAGTPLYMAPEQFAGSVATSAADLYALGTILYELMAGALPYPPGESIYSITTVRNAPPPPLGNEHPAALRDLTMRLLASDPALRPSDASAVARELEALAVAAS